MERIQKNKCFSQSLLIIKILKGQHIFRKNHYILLEINME